MHSQDKTKTCVHANSFIQNYLCLTLCGLIVMYLIVCIKKKYCMLRFYTVNTDASTVNFFC